MLRGSVPAPVPVCVCRQRPTSCHGSCHQKKRNLSFALEQQGAQQGIAIKINKSNEKKWYSEA